MKLDRWLRDPIALSLESGLAAAACFIVCLHALGFISAPHWYLMAVAGFTGLLAFLYLAAFLMEALRVLLRKATEQIRRI